ncbi:MAG: hypothetical protein MI741_15505 [Rhodospirillales bacterium]|nr:hypothetical protein [Rhodospirillales bacterium]
MNLNDEQYTKFGLVKDMLATPGIVEKFDCDQMAATAQAVRAAGKLLMTGEGSSRIFPAKHVMKVAMQRGYGVQLATEAGKQAQEYKLDAWAVFALSNSGRTAEVIQLFNQLAETNHANRFSLTAFADTKLESLANQGYVLSCGEEGAVAATKSVIEQALFYQALIEHVQGDAKLAGDLQSLAAGMGMALTQPIESEIIDKVAGARLICFAGRNDGVAEELTLKTNEITRKPSDFFEGTYGAHGVEEVLNPQDVVIWIDPYEDQESKFEDVLVKGVGLTIIAISPRDTRFPTIRIPDAGDLSGYVQMCAGWSVLVETGIRLGIDLDKPERARKVGNEFVG